MLINVFKGPCITAWLSVLNLTYRNVHIYTTTNVENIKKKLDTQRSADSASSSGWLQFLTKYLCFFFHSDMFTKALLSTIVKEAVEVLINCKY